MKRILFPLIFLICTATQAFAANGDLLVEGKAGIGTTSPTAQLDLQGSKLFRLGYMYLNSNVVPANSYQRFSLGYGIYWDDANSNYMVTDPTYNQATFSNENGKFVWTVHNGALTSPQTYAQWHANDKMVISREGNIGIGSGWPTARLQIDGVSDQRTPGTNGDSVLRLTNAYTAAYGSGPEIQFGLSESIAGATVLSLIKGTYSAWTSPPYFGGDLCFYTRTAVDGTLSEHMRIKSTGNIGIGTTNPQYKLQVNGSFAATSKNFDIPDPRYNDPKKRLIHASVEGPENAVFYRGEVRLENGKAVVQLPAYFESLTRKENRTVIITPAFETEDEQICSVAASTVKDGSFKIRAFGLTNPDECNHSVYWEVKAERSDIGRLKVEATRE